jgi:3-oxoadipate enol-lactonase
MNFALHAPERIGALVLVDTAPKIGTTESWNFRIGAIAEDGIEPFADTLVGRWFAPSFRETHPADFAGWRNMLLRTSAEGYIASCAAVRDADLTTGIGSIATPTLAVAGDQDISTPPDLVRDMAERIPGARFELIASAGHLPAIEQPAILAGLIADHFVESGYV